MTDIDNKQIDVQPLGFFAKCSCPNHELIPVITLRGNERTYIHGHNPTSTRFKRGHVPWDKGRSK
jgi:hypothetical protein